MHLLIVSGPVHIHICTSYIIVLGTYLNVHLHPSQDKRMRTVVGTLTHTAACYMVHSMPYQDLPPGLNPIRRYILTHTLSQL
jgi:hypothetical protein